MKEKVAEEFKKNPPKAPRTTPNKRKDVTPKNTQAIANKPQKNRNAGKQNRKQAIVGYIDYYNNKRIKVKLKGLSPV